MAVDNRTSKIRKFIGMYYQSELNSIVKEGKTSICVDFSKLNGFDTEIAEDLLYKPEETIKDFEEAIKEEAETLGSDKDIRARFFNLPKNQFESIKNLRSKHLNKLVLTEGLIRQASDIRPKTIMSTFECLSCNSKILIPQTGTKLKEPNKCNQCSKKVRFRRIEDKLVDIQMLVIEESPESLEGGEQSKRIRCYLDGDILEPELEKHRYPGNKVKIVGILKEIPIPTRSGSASTKYDFLVEVNHIETVEEEFAEIKISKEDERIIKGLASKPDIYERLVSSIAPSIYGYSKVKEAIALQLFGGVKKVKSDGTELRGDIHIFLVGDPGTGKSIMLRYINHLAPKSRYVAGKGTSAAGITASVVKDEFLGGWTLEAGTLVLANKGIALIDELDKMSLEDTSAMHEALEQQTVSISKANIQATLRAETSVLAAANPKFGRFDPYSPIPNQINMPSTLLNRFDLIFTIRDILNPKADEALAQHVLELQGDIESKKGDINPELLKKFIAYAKQKCKPKLTIEASNEIKRYYVKLRSVAAGEGGDVQSIPISPRQLQALVRLAEAAAKVRLSERVTKDDAKRAIKLVSSYMADVGTDPETGKYDIDRIVSGITASQRSRIVSVKKIIDDLEEKFGRDIPTQEIISAAENSGFEREKIEEVLESLKKKGDIFEPRAGMIQKIS